MSYFGGDSTQIRATGENLSVRMGEFDKTITRLYTTTDYLSKIWTGIDSNESLQKINSYKPTAEELKKTIQGCANLLMELSDDLNKVRSSISDSADNLFK